jgi:hypothetical protein
VSQFSYLEGKRCTEAGWVGSTNYIGTFIRVAEDCAVSTAEIPPRGPESPTVASLQHELIDAHPYELTSDDVLFEVHARRHGISAEDRDEARRLFFEKDQACLRSSPLGKRYGWGIHHDEEGRVALVPVESELYAALSSDDAVRQIKAMRSKRA